MEVLEHRSDGILSPDDSVELCEYQIDVTDTMLVRSGNECGGVRC